VGSKARPADAARQPVASSGLTQRNPVNRAKSRSRVTQVAPSSIATAARRAAATRLPRASAARHNRSTVSQCRGLRGDPDDAVGGEQGGDLGERVVQRRRVDEHPRVGQHTDRAADDGVGEAEVLHVRDRRLEPAAQLGVVGASARNAPTRTLTSGRIIGPP